MRSKRFLAFLLSYDARALRCFRILIVNTRPSGGRGCCRREKNNAVFGASLTNSPWKSSPQIRLFITYGPPATRQKRKGITVWWIPLGRPSRAAPLSSSLFLSETSISPGPAIHETRTIPGATKITRSSRFRMIRLGPLAATAISRRNPSLHSAAPLTLRVPLCERPTRCHKGYRGVTPWLKSLSCEVHLPTKPVNEACSVRSILLFANPQHWRPFLYFSPVQLLDILNPSNHWILEAQTLTLDLSHIEYLFNPLSEFFKI